MIPGFHDIELHNSKVVITTTDTRKIKTHKSSYTFYSAINYYCCTNKRGKLCQFWCIEEQILNQAATEMNKKRIEKFFAPK